MVTDPSLWSRSRAQTAVRLLKLSGDSLRVAQYYGVDISSRDWLKMTPLEHRTLRMQRNTTVGGGAVTIFNAIPIG